MAQCRVCGMDLGDLGGDLCISCRATMRDGCTRPAQPIAITQEEIVAITKRQIEAGPTQCPDVNYYCATCCEVDPAECADCRFIGGDEYAPCTCCIFFQNCRFKKSAIKKEE